MKKLSCLMVTPIFMLFYFFSGAVDFAAGNSYFENVAGSLKRWRERKTGTRRNLRYFRRGVAGERDD